MAALNRRQSGAAAPRGTVVAAIERGQPILTAAIPIGHSESIAQDAAHLEILRQLNLRSSIVVPLRARGETAGALALFRCDDGRPYGPSDLSLAEELAGRAALAVDNARLYREARRAIQLRDDFLSVAAHELKTPVTALLGFSQLLLVQLAQKGELDERIVGHALRAVEQGSKRISQLVSQILDVSRLESGRLVLDCQVTDLAALTQAIASAMQTTAPRHTLLVRSPSAVQALVDPLRLEQVVTNLLDNAIKYSPEGGEIVVELLQPTPGVVRLVVTDHGLGIPPERRQHIFERFYQAHEGSHTAGLGLGLYISRQIVELHGGSIWPEFPPAGGTRFFVELPTALPSGAPESGDE